MTEKTLAQQQAEGLRALADMIEHSPHIRVAYLDSFNVWCPDDAETMAEIARIGLRHGAKIEKEISGEMYNLAVAFGPVKALALAFRHQVCERVVVGTETVTKTVPDPEKLAEVPLVDVTEDVETVEWQCRPLLASDSGAVS